MIFPDMHKRFGSWPSAALSIALLLLAAVLAGIALLPDHAVLKALALAWVLFP